MEQGVNVNPEAVAAGGAQNGTQTRGGEGGGGGKSQTDTTGDDRAGAGDGGTSGGSGEADVFTPDTDGKYTHPESKEKVDLNTIAKYYRDQFGASTKGAQDLLTKNEAAEAKATDLEGQVADLTTKLEEMTKTAEGKNPEGVSVQKLQADLDAATKKVALLTETANLDAFEKATPLATGALRESLKSLARANPKATLQDLWEKNLKAGADAADAKRKADEEARKKGASDEGKGTSTREPGGGGDTVKGKKGDTGKTLEEFNKLPVAERRVLIEKYDIS